MNIQYIGLESINGPIAYIKTPKNISFDEQVQLILKNGEEKCKNGCNQSQLCWN